MFVLIDDCKNVFSDGFSDGYYTGKSYIFQGSRYAVLDKDIKKAKVYKTYKNAQKGQNIPFENYGFNIEKIESEGENELKNKS